MSTQGHVSTIEHDGTGDDREYSYACTCRHYVSRLDSHAAATAARTAHIAAVTDGTWQAEQDAEAARLADLKPYHDAVREQEEAKSDRQSAAFGVVIARQRGGDVEAAREELFQATARLQAADSALTLAVEKMTRA